MQQTLEQSGQSAGPPAGAPGVRAMAFITGCGRSGTTILGRLLERHPDVKYFNDRFDLWVRPFPFTDIWGHHIGSARAGARVALGREDAAVTQAARDWFFGLIDKERDGRPLIVEKLAINNFRLGFLLGLCPDSSLINIVRHGVEVAFSIEQKARLGHWYGQNDRKWTLLSEYAWAHGYGPLVLRCTSPFLKGLLEWRMSVEAAEKFLAAEPPAKLLRLRYEDLIADPPGVCARLQTFLGLRSDPAMTAYAAEQVRRQNPSAGERETPAGTEEIAGETLRRLGYWK
jgi:hypothetical protein